MRDYMALSSKYFHKILDIRRKLHSHPEIDNKLFNTSKIVEQELYNLGIRYKHFDNNGIVAEFGNNTGKVVALRADMDALEVIDLKDVEYKSKINGCMHACGHDAHTAIQIGSAALLKEFEEELSGMVRLIFQPAEETYGGAKEMINYGALEGVDAIFGLHVDETIDTGWIGIKKGVVHAASNPFTIRVYGKGSHGASPESGVDAIYLAAKIIDNLQGIVSREISALDNAVISVGKINGGTAANAICSVVTMDGILRTMGKELREFVKERIENVVQSTAMLYRGRAEIEFIESYPSFSNDDNLFNWFNDNSRNIEGINIKYLDRPSMGVEDFAYYCNVVPGFFYRLGCRNEEKGIVHPAHGSYFDVDEECLRVGCAVQSMNAMEFLKYRG